MTTARPAPEVAAYYAGHSAASDPGEMAGRYDGLPHGVRELAAVVRGLLIHRLEEGLFGVEHPVERMHNDAETRYVDDILRLIVGRDAAPLAQPRAYGDRFVGICRDFTLLHVSMLRHAGVPARLRSGFAGYFGPVGPDGADGFHSDHVVTEYWDERRGWLLADAQLGDPEVAARFPGVDFDPMDVPRDRFLVAGTAWQEVRAGRVDGAQFGLPGTELIGESFIAGNIRLDLAALNKVETLLWDIWGAGSGPGEEMTDEIRSLYDEAAGVTGGDEVAYGAARALFAGHDGLRTPEIVLSLAPFNGPRQVTLR
jgi:hypothetical protein